MTDLTSLPDPDDSLTAPTDLGPVGAAYWDRVADEYDISATEEPALGEVCRTLDALEEIESALREHGRVTPDGKPSPLLVEARHQRATLVRLLGLLDLPLDSTEPAGRGSASASRAARKAARARWSR